MDYREFFTTNNKSGYKTKDKWLLKNEPELYTKILNHISESWYHDLSIKEKIWYFINDVHVLKVCFNCSKPLKFRTSIMDGYGDYCSIKCANQCEVRKENIIKTNLGKYGVESPTQTDEVKEKIRQTNIERYGVGNIFKDTEFIKSKMMDKYGVEYPSQHPDILKQIQETNIKRYGVVTPLLLDKSKEINSINAKARYKENHPNLDIINIDGNNINILCDKCGDNYVIDRSVLWSRKFIMENPCTLCYPINCATSVIELEIFNFINDYEDTEVIMGDRQILGGKQLDVYIPSKGIAVECNGVYWHSDVRPRIYDNYHLDKTLECEKQNIQLIHIFEDEWLYKKDIVKSRLLNILGKTPNKVYARKCIIKEVSSKDARTFLDTNHIQGHVNSRVKLGLYYDDELVSLMTFGGLRRNMGSTPMVGYFELLRFCNKLNTSVIGGASRLFKHFLKTYNPTNIISYADRRWSQGNLYYQLGFNHVHNSKPSYFYVKGRTRENRFKYRKSELVKQGFDKDKTERHIMKERGIPCIHDCGAMKFEYILL